MAIEWQTVDGTLVVPNAYVKQNVESSPVNFGPSGVVAVVGESTAGPSVFQEALLGSVGANAFGADQLSAIRAKYGSGPLVDAIAGMIASSNDPEIQGAPSRFIPVKTNEGAQATATILAIGGGAYATLTDRAGGRGGNLISRVVTSAVAEVVPTTGATLLAPPQVSTDVAFRVNGAAVATATLAAADTPATMVASIAALAGVIATGGVSRSVITAVAGTLAMVVDSGFQCHVNITGTTFANAPTIGDIAYIPTGSPFAAANEGTYVVTAATTSRIDLYKLLDATGAGSARTAPTAESGLAVAATTNVQAFSPVVISNEAGVPLAGTGKSLEVANSGAAFFNNVAFTFASATSSPPAAAATWVSTTSAPHVLTSGAEYKVSITASRQSDQVSDTVTSGGDVLLAVGYLGTTASAVIASGVMTITVTGGAGTSQTVTLSDYPTVTDLAGYLDSLAGYTAAAGNASTGQRAASDLDTGTYGIASTMGSNNGRIKGDAAKFVRDANAGLSLVIATGTTGVTGLPDVATAAFLSGGSRGGTTDANIAAALEAIKPARVNFVLACFAQDATADYAANLTESSSTYTIAAIAANLRSHVLACRTFKANRNRLGLMGFKGTFLAAKAMAGTLAGNSVTLAFQDCTDLDAVGNLRSFQPWMLAAKAVGMQAAGGYRPIVNKLINVSGVVQAAGDFDADNLSQLEDALKAGLLPAGPEEGGGFKWVSDQTTYSRDSNFVYNSLQANYVGDLIAQGLQRTCQRAFVGQSVADISASSARTVVETYLADAKRLKYIAASSDAPQGWKNLSINLTGPVLQIAVNVKLAGAIYFVPINVTFSQVTQSA